ncbi:MAG: hypothetical protein IT350_16195 [Deltaproteobacteria bacterium]|nr:hypothetical protein [Deltaproteobacteria bacterium]
MAKFWDRMRGGVDREPRWSRVRRWVLPARRHTLVMWIFTALNLTGVLFLVVSWHTSAVWTDAFNLKIPTDQRVARAMLAVRLDTQPTELRIRYRPSETTSALGVLFNYQADTIGYEGLRLSTKADGVSTWIQARETDTTATPVPAKVGEEHELVFRFADGRVRVDQNGAQVHEGPLVLSASTIHLLADPGMKVPAWRSPWSAVDRFVVRFADGSEREFVPGAFRVVARRIGAVLLAIVLFWMADGLIASAARGRSDPPGIVAQLVAFYPALPFLVVFGFALFNNLPGQKSKRNLYGAYMEDGYFNARAFEARRELSRSDRKIFFPVESNSDVILVFGGVPAAGDPTTKSGPTWPTMLQTRFDEGSEFPDYRFKVVNLADPVFGMEAQFPPGIQPFLKSVMPRVVIFSSLMNDFFIAHDSARVAYNLGLYDTATEELPDETATFTAHLQYALSLVRETGALAIVLDEPVDLRVFGKDPMATWRRPFLEQAAKFGALVVRTQDNFAAVKDRWLFFDFDLPNREGQRMMAKRVYDALGSNRDRIPPPLTQVSRTPPAVPTPAAKK